MPKVSERRLDSLAKILECSSMCTSIACVDNKFFISSNEFNKNSSENSDYFKLIVDIMNYFKAIANSGKHNINTRDQLMHRICKARLGAMGKGNLVLPEEVISNFITSKRLVSSNNPKKSECKNFRKTTTNVAAKASAAFADMQRIYGSFRKIEQVTKHYQRTIGSF